MEFVLVVVIIIIIVLKSNSSEKPDKADGHTPISPISEQFCSNEHAQVDVETPKEKLREYTVPPRSIRIMKFIGEGIIIIVTLGNLVYIIIIISANAHCMG